MWPKKQMWAKQKQKASSEISWVWIPKRPMDLNMNNACNVEVSLDCDDYNEIQCKISRGQWVSLALTDNVCMHMGCEE